MLADHRFHQSQPAREIVKKCELDHVWEKFTATFSVSYPLEIQGTTMTIITTNPKIGSQIMQLNSSRTDWMIGKYGD